MDEAEEEDEDADADVVVNTLDEADLEIVRAGVQVEEAPLVNAVRVSTEEAVLARIPLDHSRLLLWPSLK